MIVLLTDFGQSEYVGVIKGVIYSIDPDARIVDLCHDLSPQSIIEAAWILKNSYSYFLPGSVFCCVVDPGVGTHRRALAVKTESYYFVGPDNGLLWETLREQQQIDIRNIPIPPDASRTFHGRDVFATAAAKIHIGCFEDFCEKAEHPVRFEFHRTGCEGLVVRIDRFGNVITNLPAQGKSTYRVSVGGKNYAMNFYQNYASAEPGELFLVEGSCRTLEISLKDADANARLHLKAGDRIRIL